LAICSQIPTGFAGDLLMQLRFLAMAGSLRRSGNSPYAATGRVIREHVAEQCQRAPGEARSAAPSANAAPVT
jgi:hypothetical protein